MSTRPAYQRFVGSDIAAKSAMVALTRAGTAVSRPFEIEQTSTGISTPIQRLQAGGVPPAATLVVMEATGSYWITLAPALHHAGFAVSGINPAQAHAFAKALLKRAKPDAIDAQTLAQLAALLQPEAWTPPPAVYHELQQRLAQRDALMDIRQQVRNQLHALGQGPVVIAAVRARMETLIATLSAQIAEVEAEGRPALAHDAVWAVAAARLESIKGVGLLTASWMLVTTLNVTVCSSAEEATAYAGVAPNEGRSGTRVWKRPQMGHTGNARLRTALYLATLNAAQTNPAIKTFYDRLVAAGKLKQVARCAAARKLLHVAWAVVTKEHMWDPNYTTPPPR